ncbi:polyprenyl synthetase family protein [Marinitoga sp. 1137]|uniref:polyprenyl synthetase family protein n=1 Tax=Marinitoga sp. 1137 TaxID=1545835 RepID=UPI000AF008EC|nr:polyprenyl synthetase family protein [Marinitoga sp. 1137]
MEIKEFKEIFEKKAEEIFSELNLLEEIEKPFKYSFFAGGKRLRPWIIYNIGRYYNIEEEKLLRIGFAVEILHTASLIHDDLPAIDNSNYRRGKLTNHKQFSEWQAILTGDAGFVIPFKVFSNNFSIDESYKLTGFFSEIMLDLIQGEALDVAFERGMILPSQKSVEEMYRKKTSALFEFSFGVIPYLKDLKEEYQLMKKAGKNFGLAFQIYDDLKDKYGKFEEVGKDLNNDENKITLIALYSDEKAKNYAEFLFKEANDILLKLGFKDFSNEILKIKQLIERK